MFQEVKDTLPVMGDDYDAQIIREIKACAIDLTTSAEIKLPGVIDITREAVTETDPLSGEEEFTGWQIVDNSTITDEFVITVIATWCNMRIGNPPNYGNLLSAYNSLKGQMRLSKTYTEYGDEAETEADAEAGAETETDPGTGAETPGAETPGTGDGEGA